MVRNAGYGVNASNDSGTAQLLGVFNGPIDLGEPPMPREQVESMFAHVLYFPEIFSKAHSDILEAHFDPDTESDLAIIWRYALAVAEEAQSQPSLSAIARAIQADSASGTLTAVFAEDVDGIIGEQGMLARLTQYRPEQSSVAAGRTLVQRFLLQRGVYGPICQRIVAVRQAEPWNESHNLPSDLREILKRSADLQEQILDRWSRAEDWPAPEPLDGPDLAAFPLDALPEGLRAWVAAEATATQTPVDLAGMLSLAVCSAALAKTVEVQVNPGFREPVNLYAVTILESGNRKSAVFADATRPLQAYEEVAVAQTVSAVRSYEQRYRVLTQQRDRLEKVAARASDTNQRNTLVTQADQVAQELESLSRVVTPKLLADDCTPEKLEMLLADQGGRIAVMSAEGGVFEMIKGRYSTAAKCDVYLKGHAGDPIRTDRVGRQSVFVNKPAVTLGLAVQPEVIRALGERPELRGQGLLARFLYAMPRSLLGRRDIAAPPVPADIAFIYGDLVGCLCRIVSSGIRSATLAPQYLRLSAGAAARFQEFQMALEPRLGSCGDLASLKDWGGKLAGAVIRLAGILHCVREAEGYLRQQHDRTAATSGQFRWGNRFQPWEHEILLETMSAAISIAEYLVPHTQAAFALMAMAECFASQVVADSWLALQWVLRHGLTVFTKRGLHQGLRTRARLRKVNDLDPIIELLIARNIIRCNESVPVDKRAGRPPSQTYVLNPRAANLVVGAPEAGYRP